MTEHVAGSFPKMFGSLVQWAGRIRLADKLAVMLAAAATVAGITTYVVFTQPAADAPRATDLVLMLLYLDLALLLALGVLVARRMVQVWVLRRRGSAGSKMHIRLVVLFSLVAVFPAIVVAVFSALVFNFGLQNWFSERVRTALTESTAVAESYLQEHRRNIAGDVLAMANDVNRQGPVLADDPSDFSRFLEFQTQLRNLSEAVVFSGSGRVLGRSRMSFTLAFERAPLWALEQARRGGVVYLESEDEDRIRALVALGAGPDAFLLVGRFVDPRVLDRIEQTKSAVSAYRSLEQVRSDLQILYAAIFVVVALLLLFVAVWIGLNFANRLARPISGLVAAAERVRAGDLSARVEENGDADELDTLSRAFNRMTSQLESQRTELVEASRVIDTRRRFIEAVLSGVSAGVIGLDRDGCIYFPNQTASDIMATDLRNAIGRPITEFVPEMRPMLERARRDPGRVQEQQIDVQRRGRTRTLLVRITVEGERGDARGFVVTFDDITELISAQRKAAWSDVARRLAHEIKNPLTPIQLAAERLKRRYLSEVTSDPQTFSTCIDTIIRQVSDIGNMITEFSSFARMPAPTLKDHDLTAIVRQAVFLQRSAKAEIQFEVTLPDSPVRTLCDDRQVGQALTNLLQNAAESIQARSKKERGVKGRIAVTVRVGRRHIAVTVEDNGIGLPKELGRDITDPYVTTRAEGTGLGLAIVRKIMEDHGGEIAFEDGDGGGARVSLLFPVSDSTEGARRGRQGAHQQGAHQAVKTPAHES
jgi:two-component system nitrogen regulation sensor histidine kinase NtrY